MESYDITKDDWDNVMEMCKLPGKPDVMSQIPPKVPSLVLENVSISCWHTVTALIFTALIFHDLTTWSVFTI